MAKHDHYDSDMQLFDVLHTKLENGTFTDADCESFGHVMRSLERPRAIELLQTVIAQHPAVGDTYVYLGSLLLEENRLSEACEIFEKAANIDLYFGQQGYGKLAEYLSSTGDKENASKFEALKKHADASFAEWKNFDYDEDGKLIIVDEPIIPEHWGNQIN